MVVVSPLVKLHFIEDILFSPPPATRIPGEKFTFTFTLSYPPGMSLINSKVLDSFWRILRSSNEYPTNPTRVIQPE